MSKEKQMFNDLVEIFEEEYENRRMITPHNTAKKMTEKSYRKQRDGRWKGAGLGDYYCSLCCSTYSGGDEYNYCPNCGAKMKGGE